MGTQITLGPFALEAALGRGGMGVVWGGIHVPTSTPVAVKIITAAGLTDAYRARFQAEVRAMAGCDHPGIVTVLDYGEIGEDVAAASDGQLIAASPYLVMEHIEGGTLSDLVGRPPPWPRLVALVCAILEGLGHAHARGLVHRDIKPTNVLLDRSLAPVLCDFGIVHLLGSNPRAAERVGTLHYMAPEQIRSQWRDLGPWTDLYALGATIWKLVTGAPPFSRERLPEGHLDGHFPAFRPRLAVPARLHGWLRRMTDRDPRARFTYAADAMAALRDIDDPPDSPRVYTDAELVDNTEIPVPRTPFEADWRTAVRRRSSLLHVGQGLYRFREVSIVGRQAERDRLWAALGRVHDTRSAHALLVSGPSGVGKSRLASWLQQRAHEHGLATPFRLHAASSGRRRAIEHMVEEHVQVDGLELEDARARLLDLQPRLGIEGARLLSRLLDPASSTTDTTDLYGTVVHWFDIMLTERPGILWVDQADRIPEAAPLIQAILARSGLPLLAVVTTRDDWTGSSRAETTMLEQVRSHPRVSPLIVGPLPPDEHFELIRELLRLDGPLVARIAERTAGNPMFAIQLVGDWVERNVLRPTDAGFQLTASDEADIPDALEAVWRRRFERAVEGRPLQEVEGLELAGALGNDVDPAEWSALCDGAAPWSFVEQLIRERLALAGDDGPTDGWSFVHPMFREAIVGHAKRNGRWEEHNRRCARMLRDHATGDAGRRGRHLAEAGELERALTCLASGIGAAMRRNDFAHTGALLTAWRKTARKAEVPQSDPRAMRVAVEDLNYRARSMQAEKRHERYAALTDRLRQLNNAPVLAWCLASWARILNEEGRYEEAWARAEEAHSLARVAGQIATAGDARNTLGNVALRAGEPNAAREHFAAAAAAFAEVDDDVGRAAAALGLFQVHLREQRLGTALAHLRSARKLFTRAGNNLGVAACVNHAAEVHREMGDLARAEAGYREAMTLHRVARGEVPPRLVVNAAMVQLERGNTEEARDTLEILLEEPDPDFAVRLLGRAALLTAYPLLGDWQAWDVHMTALRDQLGEAHHLDPELARLVESAGVRASQHNRIRRALMALAIASEQYRRLGRPADRARIDRMREELTRGRIEKHSRRR